VLAYLTAFTERLPRSVAALILEGPFSTQASFTVPFSPLLRKSVSPHQADVILRPTSSGM
jgi:hypothetical protein